MKTLRLAKFTPSLLSLSRYWEEDGFRRNDELSTLALPPEAHAAIGAALRGESEPIRNYGVLLDDATMRQKAFELGLTSSTKNALLPQTKVLAVQ
jgi:hypothetical protein